MPNTFSKLYIHHVSAVKYRQALILPSFEEELYKYIVGIIKNLGQTPLQVNGMPDHIHIAARLRPDMAPATFVQKVKANSSKWINDQGFLPQRFNWQTGGGTFSVSRTHVDALRHYIKNQKAHHAKKSFRKEYLDILKRNEIEPDPDYLPDFFED
ncbi:MAG: IS200/IS605 family transposase [Phaeodactylibacter sp.]|uniref:IS200/IS605 family transposase n=1 Tax=Phaeodactylibacter sp. TaxID=1940289 RepID=UPI0032F08370